MDYLPYLLIDSFFDLLMTVGGITLIAMSRGNRMRLLFGILALAVGLTFMDDNIELLLSPDLSPVTHGYSYADILVPGRMMEWILPATACSLFPLISLRPGFLSPLRLVLFSLPIGATMLTQWCYDLFNGTITRLHSLSDVVANIGEMDVKVRLFVFAMGVIVPSIYFFFPFLWRFASVKRKTTPLMWAFIAGMFVILIYYAAFMLVPSKFLFATFNVVVEIFFIVFMVLFIRRDDPLSFRESQGKYIVPHQPSPEESLYADMEAWLERNHPFTDPQYSITNLAASLNARSSHVNEAVKAGGFSGFREYMNYLRVEYFKGLARSERTKSIKELMHESGFTSRSSFYRLFAEYENMTPSDYIDSIRRKKQVAP